MPAPRTKAQREAVRAFLGEAMPNNAGILVENIEEFMPATFRVGFECLFGVLTALEKPTVQAFNTVMNGGNDPRVASRLHIENPAIVAQIPAVCLELCEGVESAQPKHPLLIKDVQRALWALAHSPLLRRLVVDAEREGGNSRN